MIRVNVPVYCGIRSNVRHGVQGEVPTNPSYREEFLTGRSLFFIPEEDHESVIVSHTGLNGNTLEFVFSSKRSFRLLLTNMIKNELLSATHNLVSADSVGDVVIGTATMEKTLEYWKTLKEEDFPYDTTSSTVYWFETNPEFLGDRDGQPLKDVCALVLYYARQYIEYILSYL